MGMVEKLKIGVPAAIAGIVGGLLLPTFIEGTPSNNYSTAIENQMDTTAAGGAYDKTKFGADKLSADTADNVRFALDTMLRLAGQEDVADPNQRIRAAASCVLAVANGIPLSQETRNDWSGGRNNERSEAEGADALANKGFSEAADSCINSLVGRAEQPDNTFVMTVPVSATA